MARKDSKALTQDHPDLPFVGAISRYLEEAAPAPVRMSSSRRTRLDPVASIRRFSPSRRKGSSSSSALDLPEPFAPRSTTRPPGASKTCS